MFWNTDEALTVHVVYMHASLLGWGKIKFTIYAEYQNLTSKTCNLMKHNEQNVSAICCCLKSPNAISWFFLTKENL